MTLKNHVDLRPGASLTAQQRRRVADALEDAQSENTRKNYASQFRQFRAWCQREGQSPLPASPEVVAAYAAEMAENGKSISTIRLALSAIVDAHRQLRLASPLSAGVSQTLRGLSRRLAGAPKQAKPLDADALAAIKATAFLPRTTRGGLRETQEAAKKRGLLDIALASLLSDAGMRVSEAARLRWCDILDADDTAGLLYIARSKTDPRGEGAFVAITGKTLDALRQLRQYSKLQGDEDLVLGLSISQISRRVVSMAIAAGLGAGYSSHSGRVGLAIRMTRRGAPLQALQTHGRWKSPAMPARYTRGEKALQALEWL